MDGFSVIIGGTLGLLAGWAFSSASFKQRDANRKQQKVSKAKEEMLKKEGEVKNNRDGSLIDAIQGFALNALGFGVVLLLGVLFFSSLFN